MTHKQLLKLAQKATIAVNKARDAINAAEMAYGEVFDTNPSDIDNDGWIDTVQYGNGWYDSVQQIIDDHNLHTK